MIMLCVPYAAMIGLQYLTQEKSINRKKLVMAYRVMAFFLAVILFLIAGAKGLFSFISTSESLSDLPSILVEPLQASRKMLVWEDIRNIIIFLVLITLTLVAFWRKLLSGTVFVIIIAIISLADLWQYNRLFFNKEQFKSKYQ